MIISPSNRKTPPAFFTRLLGAFFVLVFACLSMTANAQQQTPIPKANEEVHTFSSKPGLNPTVIDG